MEKSDKPITSVRKADGSAISGFPSLILLSFIQSLSLCQSDYGSKMDGAISDILSNRESFIIPIGKVFKYFFDNA